MQVCDSTAFIFLLNSTRKSKRACLFIWLFICMVWLDVHGNTLLDTCAHVYEIECIPWNVFWFLMLCGGGVYTLCKRIFSLCPVAKT